MRAGWKGEHPWTSPLKLKVVVGQVVNVQDPRVGEKNGSAHRMMPHWPFGLTAIWEPVVSTLKGDGPRHIRTAWNLDLGTSTRPKVRFAMPNRTSPSGEIEEASGGVRGSRPPWRWALR